MNIRGKKRDINYRKKKKDVKTVPVSENNSFTGLI